MKFGVAVVAGAFVMFASGYMLGYTTAVPDVLRATSLDLDELGTLPDDSAENTFQGEFEIPVTEDPAGAVNETNEQMVAEEMENLKRMVVPLLTDEEIKRIREEVAKAAAAPEAASPAPAAENAP
jgi:hypothetical protein